jgi:CDP-diacylglycerol--serine O-phosphatidyltransferase
MVFDFLDGLSARLLKAYSDIGKELDSLADVVSFGVAPGFIIYKMISDLTPVFVPSADNCNLWPIVLIFPAIMPVCGALRLAVFNLDSTQTTSFKGLPIPANALAVISIIIAGHYSQSELLHSFTNSTVLLLLFTLVLSLLMVSRIPLFSLKIRNFRFKGNEGRYILLFFVLAAFIIFGILGITLIIPLYIVASALSLLF